KQISKSRSTVTELMTIAGLPKGIRERCFASKIDSKSTLLAIARQFDEPAMFEYLDGLETGKGKKRHAEKGSGNRSSPNDAAAKPSVSRENNSASTFEYTAQGGVFSVKVKFDSADKPNRESVLKALKEAF